MIRYKDCRLDYSWEHIEIDRRNLWNNMSIPGLRLDSYENTYVMGRSLIFTVIEKGITLIYHKDESLQYTNSCLDVDNSLELFVCHPSPADTFYLAASMSKMKIEDSLKELNKLYDKILLQN